MINSGLTPSATQYALAALCFDDLRILNVSPWQLRESFPLNRVPSLLRTEVVLLRIRRVPDPVHEQVQHRPCG